MALDRFRTAGGFAAALIAAGCASDPLGPGPGPGGDPEPSFDLLFAPATPSEIAAVRGEWDARRPAALDARVEQVVTTSFGTMTGEATVISHRVDGNTHYGALFVPDGAPADAPVLIFLHGGDGGISIPGADTDHLIGGLGSIKEDVVYLIPSFRSEELRVGGQAYRSGGDQSPWDRDVDDALSLLEAAIALAPQRVDPGRIAAMGVSRGGLVALLMAVRDPRILGVVELSGPTDFFGDYVRARLEEAAAGVPRGIVGLEYLDDRFIQPWLRGEVSTQAFRRELVRRSPVLFAADLPRVQLHHGSVDDVVEVSQAQALIDALEAEGRGSPDFEGYIYPGGSHQVTSLAGAPGRMGGFLDAAWLSVTADLSLTHAGPSQATVGDTIAYVIATRNVGPQTATSVVVTDTLPQGAVFVEASGGGTLNGGVVSWPSLLQLPSGGERLDTVRVVVQQTGSFTGVAAVTSGTADPDRSDNRAAVTTRVGTGAPDLNALFATPTSTEIAAVRAEWSARNPRSVSPTVVQSMSVTASGVPGRLTAVSHMVDGLTHYGAYFVPNGVAPSSAPIVVYLHGGDSGVTVPGSALTDLVAMLKGLSHDFVYVFPSFRGESLFFGGTTYRSAGSSDPWDRDVDDALSLLEVVIATVPEADPGRIAAIGISRGGLVAQLMGIRDPRIDGVAELSGPTDFYDSFAQGIITGLVAGQPAWRAGMDVINQRYIQPWVRGALPLADMRRELIRRSAVLFAASLPDFQLHHGTADPVVEVSQAQSMITRMTGLGRTPPAFEGFLYAGGTHNRTTLTGAPTRIRSFISGLFP